jgi:GNAT superfamily N-acetyltransferase
VITIEEVGPDYSPKVFSLVSWLLDELKEDADEATGADTAKILADWRADENRVTVFIAFSESMEGLGIITLAENFAIYAGGKYGIINELYVEPNSRNRQVGKMLVETAKAFARTKGWKRLDVTAPPGERWQRTVNFYLREGFVHTGPKLKFML